MRKKKIVAPANPAWLKPPSDDDKFRPSLKLPVYRDAPAKIKRGKSKKAANKSLTQRRPCEGKFPLHNPAYSVNYGIKAEHSPLENGFHVYRGDNQAETKPAWIEVE